MKEKRMESFLYCLDCDEETSHTILYINDEIYHIECRNCGREYGVGVVKEE